MKFGVVIFPGSNCETDAFHAVRDVLHEPVEYLWHESSDLKNSEVIILPGGFAYGDYLRTGAIAQHATIMREVIRFAKNGGLVWGICNGFQILCESGLLPGALIRNAGLRFKCTRIFVRVERTDTPFTRACKVGEVLELPINHGEGNYVNTTEEIARLESNGQVVFRYCDQQGNVTPESNPNGSVNNIAGICSREGNILGMMPHPERVVESLIGGTDGLKLFQSIVKLSQQTAARTA